MNQSHIAGSCMKPPSQANQFIVLPNVRYPISESDVDSTNATSIAGEDVR